MLKLLYLISFLPPSATISCGFYFSAMVIAFLTAFQQSCVFSVWFCLHCMVQLGVLASTFFSLFYDILLNEASPLLLQLLQTQSYYYLHARLIKLRVSFNKTNRH